MRCTAGLLLLFLSTFALIELAQAQSRPAATSPTTTATTGPASRPKGQILSTTELSRQVNTAIERGVQFLLSRQTSDGGWVRESDSGFGIGPSALVTFALLTCGEQASSRPMTDAINLLKRNNGREYDKATYSVGLRANVWALLPQASKSAELKGDLSWLLGHMMDPPMVGIYNYGSRGGGDYSNSQYGVLGVWAAADAGLEVPISYWRAIENGWRRGQLIDGGWGYVPSGEGASYASMTAAAVATLFITNDYLHAREYQNLSRQVENAPLDAGLQWLAENFQADDNANYDMRRIARPRGNGGGFRGGAGRGIPPRRGAPRGNQRGPFPGDRPANNEPSERNPNDPFLHYTLFAYERVGEASGLTRFGDHYWYEEGAEHLIETQRYDGSWIGRNEPEIATAYALLFLARGRSPVVVQKLEFGDRSNNRPRDIAGFTRFMRNATERHVNWQVLPVDAPMEEYRAAPLLYAASDKALTLTSAQKDAIRSYIDDGGLLVAANEGTTQAFSQSVINLCKELYPAYSFRDLPKDHPIYTTNFAVKIPTGPIRGLSNGLRELVVLYPTGDMPWQWHSSGGALAAGNSVYASLANLWLYATDRANPRFKGEDTWVDRNPGVQPTQSLKVARIRHDGNWDPEPAGWTRISNIMANFDQMDVAVDPVSTSIPATFGLAHLTTTRSLNLNAATKTAMKTYISAGGLLLMDAAGGSSEVPASFDQLIKELFPTATVSPLPLTHPIYHATAFGGQDIDNVEYRRVPSAPTVKIPRLRGVTLNGKLIAILSYEDLSGAMVAYAHSGLNGYTPASASDLMRNLILWRAGTPAGKK